MEIEFFSPMRNGPPKTTAQERQVRIGRDGKPHFFQPAEVKTAKQDLTAALAIDRPTEPLQGALSLTVRFLFPAPAAQKHTWSWKTTRPDTDNLLKLLQDVMTDLGFWSDDSQVVRLIAEKYNVREALPGIYVHLKQIPTVIEDLRKCD